MYMYECMRERVYIYTHFTRSANNRCTVRLLKARLCACACACVCVYITRSASSRHMARLLRASVSDCVNNQNERYVYINMKNYIDVCMYE